MPGKKLFATVCLFAVAAVAVHLNAQAAGGAATQAIPEVAQALDFARASKKAGRTNDALDTVAAVLKRYPASTDAATFQVETLLELDQYDEANKAYDAYAAAAKRQDLALLSEIARADLVRTVKTKADQKILVAHALERLARQGDAEALRALRGAAVATSAVNPESLAPVIALARLKEPAGEARLTEILGASVPTDRAQAIQAMAEADVRGQIPRVVLLLGDADINVRNAAAIALGKLQARQAIPQLKNAFDNDVGAVKMFAAVSLKQLGDPSADKFLDTLLNGEIAEIRIIAAGAYRFATTSSPAWKKAVRELMAGPNEVHQLQAAELLASVDVPAARSALTSALASPNPLLRAGAAKILEARPELADPNLARRVLGDSAPAVRIHGAGLVWALAQRGKTPPGR
jgi:HEAT repeat protein